MERERRPAVMKFIGDYWDTVEDEHAIWSDVASFSLRQHTTKYSMCTPSIWIFLVLFTPGSSMLKININPYSKTLIFFLNSTWSSATVCNMNIHFKYKIYLHIVYTYEISGPSSSETSSSIASLQAASCGIITDNPGTWPAGQAQLAEQTHFQASSWSRQGFLQNQTLWSSPTGMAFLFIGFGAIQHSHGCLHPNLGMGGAHLHLHVVAGSTTGTEYTVLLSTCVLRHLWFQLTSLCT